MATHDLIELIIALPIFDAGWVLYLLFGCSILSMAIVFERGLFYRRHAIDAQALGDRLDDLLSRGDFTSARALLAEYDAIETNVALAGLARHTRGPTAVEDLMAGAQAKERDRYGRSLGWLATIGSNAPFIGLFGTVLGIIQAFRALGLESNGAAPSVMSELSEALVATGVGLLVAIPALIAFNGFNGTLDRRSTRAEVLSRAVLSRLRSEDPREEA